MSEYPRKELLSFWARILARGETRVGNDDFLIEGQRFGVYCQAESPIHEPKFYYFTEHNSPTSRERVSEQQSIDAARRWIEKCRGDKHSERD